MWKVVYKKAYNPDGSLFFPQKLSAEFLENAKRTMGSYFFANQYLNEVLPSEHQPFKRSWFKYYESLPELKNTAIFIDPAISQEDNADYTAVVAVDVDKDGIWYLKHAQRKRMTPTEIVNHIFDLNEHFRPRVIGIEDVAFQKALLYMVDEEMKRRKMIVPLKGIRPVNDQTKEMRILTLVPRFEWGRILLSKNVQDLELELMQFPRGKHDDLIDALSQIDQLVSWPHERRKDEAPRSPNDPNYEAWYRNQLHKRSTQSNESE